MQIVRATDAHREQIIGLGARALGWRVDDDHRNLFSWKHDANPFGASPCWIALDGDRLAAFRVFLNWRFRRPDGTTVTAVRAVDTATDPDYQGQGLFRTLTTQAVDELRDSGVGFVFNTPNDQSRPGYLKMGWIELGRPPVAMAPRLRSLLKIARSRVAAERWSDRAFVATPAPEALADDEQAGSMLAAEVAHGRRWSTDRDPTWLRWRYGLERLQYQVLTTADLDPRTGSRSDAAVFRTRRRGDCVEATISELFAASPGSRRTLVRGVLRCTGADYALVAGRSRIDRLPSITLSTFSPLMTWRSLAMTEAPTMDDFLFAVGDLELF